MGLERYLLGRDSNGPGFEPREVKSRLLMATYIGSSNCGKAVDINVGGLGWKLTGWVNCYRSRLPIQC